MPPGRPPQTARSPLRLAYGFADHTQLVAEHGFSALATVESGGRRSSILYDLTGAIFEPIIDQTVAAFADLGIERIVPGHCTGWKGTHRLAQSMPEAFVQPSVGTVLRF